MPDADFHNRLQRVASDPRHGGKGLTDPSPQQGPDLRRVMIGVILTTVGAGLVKVANISYYSIRESSGLAVAIGFGLVALATVVIGVSLTFRALWKVKAQGKLASSTRYSAAEPVKLAAPDQPALARSASGVSRPVTSLLGFALGVFACACLFIASAARFVETAQAQAFFVSTTLIAMVMAVASLTIGLVGLFVRGFSLGRVPLYFVAGFVLAWAAGRLMNINLLEWPAFIAFLQ